MKQHGSIQGVFLLLLLLSAACREKNAGPSQAAIDEINLKRGAVISCGHPGKQFGSVAFETSCREIVAEDFNLAIQLLHSFEYDEAEKVFAKIIDEQPACAMAYWGVAMSNFHPLWTPPTAAELKKGAKAIEIAQSITQKSEREAAYIAAIGAFYADWDNVDHATRCRDFEKAMANLFLKYPNDKEAAIFYALALNAAADPADKTFKKQLRAGAILKSLYPKEPNHPGIIHYIIHTYDSPELAKAALPAARIYASVAPSSAHALHMPSHIFTRLGLWEECIDANLASVSAAQCYAEAAGLKGHWDEELHGLDYLVYAYLQKGESDLAKKQWDYLRSIREVYPVNFKVAYAYAAIPSRYLLENRLWEEAAHLEFYPQAFPWKDYPWQKAIVHFTRLLGAVHTNDLAAANNELKELNVIHEILEGQKDAYKANQVQIQLHAANAWILFKAGKHPEALARMNLAADMEDKTEKHPVTPGEIVPARALLADLLLQMNKPEQALAAYQADLKKHPNRFNGLYGAGLAAERAGDPKQAGLYYQKLLAVASTGKANRPELTASRQFVKKHKYF
jgi:tetratricopeptide (TPR) repeat protein